MAELLAYVAYAVMWPGAGVSWLTGCVLIAARLLWRIR